CRNPLAPDAGNTWDWDVLSKSIRAQGGISIIAHPRGLPGVEYFNQADGMEIFDMADAMREKIIDVPRELLEFVLAPAKYREELLLPMMERMNWPLVKWDSVSRARRFVGVAGNDAHQNLALFGHLIDRYDLIFRTL